MKLLDRAGTFKAVPQNWGLAPSKDSKSVALLVEFLITAQLDGDEWVDWMQYEDHSISGYFYIVKRDGGINTATVENLAQVLGYDGTLKCLQAGPPNTICQIVTDFEGGDVFVRGFSTHILPPRAIGVRLKFDFGD